MTAFGNGRSRATSARISRASSTVHDIAKRRDKPYKTEKSLVTARKRKLDLHTSYTRPPPGFVALLVGTPDLADLCKEISRQRGFPVNVVNAKPVSRMALDAGKVSHHIHRIGYHFKAEVMEEACAKLGYTLHRGRYIKELDLIKQKEQRKLAQTLAKYHIRPDALTAPSQKETPEQVRAAIRELFPKMPDADLESIVKHAWEEGTDRVGNSKLDLPRRVQLATIARIRHQYTDYDRLLRAFEWKDARAEVEPTCLKKLIEWRGENDFEDDGELEEIVRETIVIDSDDDMSDDDSVIELEPGNVSDTSIEVTHHVAADGDLGAESVDEGSRAWIQRLQPARRCKEQRNTIAKQKIGAARQQMRQRAPPRDLPRTPRDYSPAPTKMQLRSSDQAQVSAPRPVQPSDGGNKVYIEGQWYTMAPLQDPEPALVHSQYLPPAQPGMYGHQVVNAPTAVSAPVYKSINERYAGYAPHDHPVASIEHGNTAADTGAALRIRPATPDRGRSSKRPRYEDDTEVYACTDRHPQVYQNGHGMRRKDPMVPMYTDDVEVIDLTSPGREARRGYASASSVLGQYSKPARYDLAGRAIHAQPSPQFASRVAQPNAIAHNLDPTPYDPAQPLLRPAEQGRFLRPLEPPPPSDRPRIVYVESVPAQSAYDQSPAERSYEAYSAGGPSRQPQYYPMNYQQQPVYAQPAPPPLVHGAPAPVQQAPASIQYSVPTFGEPWDGFHNKVPGERTILRQDGAPFPTQYYYPT